jgi:hypothetical protein
MFSLDRNHNEAIFAMLRLTYRIGKEKLALLKAIRQMALWMGKEGNT